MNKLMIWLGLKKKPEPAERCYFCRATADREKAIDAGWIPSFWVQKNGVEVLSPACPTCVQAKLVYDKETSEYELKD